MPQTLGKVFDSINFHITFRDNSFPLYPDEQNRLVYS
jgi:hypothetical protein